MPKISVIIPVYNALEDVKLCIESIINKFNFELGEVIAINDYSNNETTDYLRTITNMNPQIQLIENTENLGFVKTCNKGMKIANGDIVVLLNSDTKIPGEFCEIIIKCFYVFCLLLIVIITMDFIDFKIYLWISCLYRKGKGFGY